MKANDILVYFSIIYNGDWNKIYEAISQKRPVNTDEFEKVISSVKCKTVTIIDEQYPFDLKQTIHPPFVLFYYGDFSILSSGKPTVSIVGSRNCSKYGEEITRKIVKDIAKHCVIVSGMAKGIDSISHDEAIKCGTKTVAVLGTGIDVCYPLSNKALYKEIKENHLLISEYPEKTMTNNSFPERNRIIAALGKGLVITEATLRSGTSITASYALQIGKSICCVPRDVNNESLCNRLIKDGAALVQNGFDVLEELDIKTE